jgi:hypothetical protein
MNTAVRAILAINPSLDPDDVKREVSHVLKLSLKDPTITMDNNVTGANYQMRLTDLCNWIEQDRPVVSGNATFYVQPDVLESPCSKMLIALKKQRKQIKKDMFDAKSRGDMDRYHQLDLEQINTKVIMNAEYGASGAPTSAFYTKYSPVATTMLAQSIITTMAALFEGFVGDNMKFFHINECIDWMLRIQDTKQEDIKDWIVIPTVQETIDRIMSHFFMYDPNARPIIEGYISNLNKRDLAYLFYANNLNEFIRRHDKPKKLLRKIFSDLPVLKASEQEVPPEFRDKFKSAVEYNDYVAAEMFLDPYNIPPVIKEPMAELTEIIMDYCYVEYLTPDSIAKLNNHKRNTVLLVDTDSNVINANLFVEFVMGEVFHGQSFGRESIYNDMICANILASILSQCIERTLDFYGRCHNAGPEARKELTMKNEFFFRRFFLMNTKKRYACSIVLREGHIMIPFKTEIKGLDFIKAGVTDDVTQRFTKILEDNVLFSEELQLHGLMRDLRKFEREIYADLRMGGTRYLKSQSYKSESAYSNPWSVQTYKAVAVWNAMFPEKKIYSLNKIKLVKLIVTDPDDLEVIKDKFPDEYERAIERVFGGIERYREYQIRKKDAAKNGSKLDERRYNPLMKYGMSTIAIPGTLNAIPEWIRPLIDYQTTISDICSSFRSILDSFRIDEIPVKTPNGRTNVTTGLISL